MTFNTPKFIAFFVLWIGACIGYGQINLDSQLVAYFKLDGNTTDQSSLAINGASSFVLPTIGKNGIANTAARFNGTTSEIECGIGNRGITDKVTVSAWIKTTMVNIGWVVGKYDWQVDKGFAIQIRDGRPFLSGRNGAGQSLTTYRANSPFIVNDGNWHYVVGVIDGNSWSLYVDCQFDTTVLSNSSSPALDNPEPLGIGFYPFGGGTFNHNYFEGTIDEVRLYNRVLSVPEMQLICDINYNDPVLSAPLATNDTTVCIDSLYTLTALSDSGTVFWESPLGTIVASGNSFTTSSNQNQTFFVYSVLNGIYSDTATINVTAQICNGFNAPSGPTNITICEDSLYYFYATADSGLIYWESPLGTVLGTGNVLVTRFSQSAPLYFYAVSNGNYSDTGSIIVTTQICSSITDPPSITNDTTVCMDSIFTLSADVSAGVVYWIDSLGNVLGNGLTFSTFVNQTTSFYCYVEFNVQITDTAEVVVSVIDCSSDTLDDFGLGVIWPNIFTPNNDGINDFFELEIPHYACLTGTVYNRWGGVVYSVNSSGFSWDGSNGIRGNQAPSGVYYYIVSYCINGETITQKGNITLVR